jgi:hypothetical protein
LHVPNKVIGAHRQIRSRLVKLLKGESGSGALIKRSLSNQIVCKDRHSTINAVRILVKVEPIGRSYHDR